MWRIFLDFIRNHYKLFIVILAVVLFFWAYNTYLVDRSLLNLRFLLEKVTAMKDNLGDARKIALILDAMITKEIAQQGGGSISSKDLEAAEKVLAQAAQLTPELKKEAQQLKDSLRYAVAGEVTKIEATDRGKIMLEMVSDTMIQPQSVSQLEDASFALKEIINDKEHTRPAFLLIIDRIADAVLPKRTGLSKERLEGQARMLERRIKDIREKDKLQEAFYELGNIHTQLNEFEKASLYYKQVIALRLNNQLVEKSEFNLAWNEKTKGNLDKALTGFQALTKTVSNPDLRIFTHFQMAGILKKQAKYEEAIDSLRQMAENEPNVEVQQLSSYLVGQVYLYDIGNVEKAQEEFQKTEELAKGTHLSQYIEKQAESFISEQYLVTGFNLLKQAYFMAAPDKYNEALKNFDLALKANPKDALSYTGKSLIFLWLGEREKALEASKKAARLSPDSEVTMVNLAYVYIELRMIDESIAELKRLLSVMPNSWQANYNLGFAYILKNNFALAAEAFQRAEKTNHDSGRILNNHAWCLWKLGRYAEAIRLLEQALFLEPNFSDAIFNLGLVYKASGRYDEAKGKLDQLFRIAPSYPDLEYYLSDVNRLMHLRNSPSSKD